MKIVTTHRQAAEWLEKLNKAFLIDYESTDTFPIKMSYIISRNRLILQDMSNDIQEVRRQIIKKYGEPTEKDDNLYSIPDIRQAQAQKDFDDFLDTKVDVELYLLDLDTIDPTVHVTAAQMDALCFMLDSSMELTRKINEAMEEK